MSQWRRVAIEKFPQLHREIADAEGAGWAWWEIRKALKDAYGQKPLDTQFVAKVYEYAAWCLHHRSARVRTAVIQWFYEDLIFYDHLRPDMARWISQDDFDLLAFAWNYALAGKNLKAFQEEFAARKVETEGIASRRQRSLIKKMPAAK